MKDCIKDYNFFLKEELEGRSELALKKGFLKDFNLECNCGKPENDDKNNIITLIRKWEKWTGNNSDSTTISSLSINNSEISGYLAEPHGEETIESGKDKRIPVGTYNLKWHTSEKFSKTKYVSKGQSELEYGFPKLYNDEVSADRGILIHIGNTGKDSEGCLLPGKGLKKSGDEVVGVTQSTEMFYDLIDYIEEKGIDKVKIIIKDEI